MKILKYCQNLLFIVEMQTHTYTDEHVCAEAHPIDLKHLHLDSFTMFLPGYI